LNKHPEPKTTLSPFDDHLDQQNGKRGTTKREKFEEGFEAFKLEIMMQELKRENKLSQAEWDKLTDTQKEGILSASKEIMDGIGISNETVMKKLRIKYSKSSRQNHDKKR
jgi:HTH-type transcriptional regulator / antitoxin HipB